MMVGFAIALIGFEWAPVLTPSTREAADTAAPFEEPVRPVRIGTDYSQHCYYDAPASFGQDLEDAAREFDVNPKVLALTVYRESSCNSGATGASGEIGLGQINPKVWSETLAGTLGVMDLDSLYDPRTNLRATAFILSCAASAADEDPFQTLRRYNGSGPRARNYALEQVAKYRSVWGSEPFIRGN